MFQEIDLALLVPHPEQCNHMDRDLMLKLRHHIEQTGNFEPPAVRPHPSERGKFQIINGHNRIRVLRALGHKSANCVVWDIDDDQARVYLATLNQISGDDIPERRALLLETLLESRAASELSELLPDRKGFLGELERLARLETERPVPAQESAGDTAAVPVILDFLLEEPAARVINLALDLLINSADGVLSRGQALVLLARFYLAHCQPPVQDRAAAAG